MSFVRTGSSTCIAYLDASALVKLAIEEEESETLRRALRAWPRRASSRVAVVEVVRAVRRRKQTAEPLARRVLAHVALVRVDDRVLAAAALLDPLALRALDAIHLASALRLGADLDAFISYDGRQLEAAAALGLPVTSPGIA
jgi:predicted nucleic acid-binding protein